jgi:hypothetical protein
MERWFANLISVGGSLLVRQHQFNKWNLSSVCPWIEIDSTVSTRAYDHHIWYTFLALWSTGNINFIAVDEDLKSPIVRSLNPCLAAAFITGNGNLDNVSLSLCHD